MTVITGIPELKKLSEDLRKTHDNLKVLGERAIVGPAFDLRNKLASNSPVASGYYRSKWISRKTRKPPTVVVAQVVVSNSTPYGIVLEIGSKKGRPPWPTPQPGTTVERKGRIWSAQAPGGVMSRTLEKYDTNIFLQSVYDQLFGYL